MTLCSRLGLHIPCPATGYHSNPFLTSRTESLPRAIIRILSSPLELKASFRSLVEKILRDPVGIRTQDPQLRRLLLYPAELPDHPLMDFPSFSQASSTRSFYVWLSHTKHHARTYAHAICGCKGTLFPRTSQINFKIFCLARQIL